MIVWLLQAGHVKCLIEQVPLSGIVVLAVAVVLGYGGCAGAVASVQGAVAVPYMEVTLYGTGYGGVALYAVAFVEGHVILSGSVPVDNGTGGSKGAVVETLAYGAGAPDGKFVPAGDPETLKVVVFPIVSMMSPMETNAVYPSRSKVPKRAPIASVQFPSSVMYAPVHPKKPSQAKRHSDGVRVVGCSEIALEEI